MGDEMELALAFLRAQDALDRSPAGLSLRLRHLGPLERGWDPKRPNIELAI